MRVWRCALLTIVAVCVYGCASGLPPATPAEEWERVDPQQAGFDAGDLESLRQLVAAGNTQSMVVVRGGRVAFSYGDVARTDGTYIASVRKSLLAMLYGAWVEQGVIRLDATLAELGIDDVQGLTDVEKSATVRDLVTSRSGIYHPASNSSGVTEDDPARGSQVPGTFYWYNNWDFNAAGGVFEQLSGRSIYIAFDDQLAKPLSLQDYDLAAHLAEGKSGDLEQSRFPAYHFFLSTRDLARLGLLMQRGGQWQGRPVLPQGWAAESVSLVTPNAEMNPERFRETGFGFGYMWWVFDPKRFPKAYRDGYAARGHFGQYIVVLPGLDIVIAHKTLPVEYDTPEEYEAINVTWDEMRVIVDAVIDAAN